MPLYRCTNCNGPAGFGGLEFEAAKPDCPECGVEGLAHIIELVPVHYDPPFMTKKNRRVDGKGKNTAACGAKATAGKTLMLSGEPSAVNCKACRKNDVFVSESVRRGIPVVPEHLDKPASDFLPSDVPGDSGPGKKKV